MLDKMGRVLKTQTKKWTTNNKAELKKEGNEIRENMDSVTRILHSVD